MGFPSSPRAPPRVGAEGADYPVDWDIAAAPGPGEVQRVSGADGDEILAPVEIVGGKKQRQVQVFVGDFDFEEESRADFERLMSMQSSFRDRLKSMNIAPDVQMEYDARARKLKE